VHPLDDDGELTRTDWIFVEGHPTASGASRGSITLDEPGSYDVLPLWRRWHDRPGDEFPDPIRIEVTQPGRPFPWVVAAVGMAMTSLSVLAWRRRSAPAH
jgi:hypothetical protein